ncbi:MAG: tetratricopeptide repeat protein, partial [Myxococcota bacterium]
PQALDALIDALDGIPLAIELAASRVGALSLAALLDKLSERLRLLRRPGRDRQATLRAVIEQSWELLAEGDREVFASLAVFARAFDADAVRAVLGTAGPEAVERLVARSLVVRTDRGYRLLDSLKAYAEERLAERDRDGVWRRHAAWFTRGAETAWAVILGPDGVSVGRRLVDDGQDLRLVIDRFAHREPTLAALAILATRPGVVRTEQDLSLDATVLTLAGRLGPVLPPPLRFALYRIAGYTLRRQGQYAEARRWFDDAYALREWIGPAALIRITADFGTLSLVSGHPADGVPWCERAVALAEALGERPLLGLVLGDLGVAYAHAGRVDASIQAYERSLAVLEACGAVVMRAVVLGNLGILDAERGQHALARQRFEEAVRMNRLAGNTRTAGVGLSNLGQLADEVGDPASALRYFGEALDVMVRTGSRRLEGVGRANLGGVLARLGRRDEARRELDRSLAIATELGHARDQATAHAELGMLDWATGDLDAAIAHLRTALALGTRGRYEVVYRGFLGAALAVRGADGDRGEAEAEHARAVETAATLRDPSLAPMLAILDAIRARHPRDRAGPPTADLAHDGPALPVGPGPHPWQVQFALDRLRDPAGSR